MSKFCLVLLCPPEIKKSFSTRCWSLPVMRYSPAPRPLATAQPMATWRVWNKLMGRARSVRVEILVTEEEMAKLLEALRTSLAGTGLRYWALPLAAEGEIE